LDIYLRKEVFMIIFDLICGFLLIFAGRNLFWLCVGMLGFLVGVQCAPALGFSNSWMVLFAAIALGGIGALLAICFEWVAIVFGVGFLGGGYLLMNLVPLTGPTESYAWPIFVVGGIVGMCLMVIIFDWTLIMISSLLGATLIVSTFHGPQGSREILFIGCMVTGILVQYLTLRNTTSTQENAGNQALREGQYAQSSKGT
jgi:hypothetical protein